MRVTVRPVKPHQTRQTESAGTPARRAGVGVGESVRLKSTDALIGVFNRTVLPHPTARSAVPADGLVEGLVVFVRLRNFVASC